MFRKLKKYWFNLTHSVVGEVWELHRVTNEHSIQESKQRYEITPHRLESLIVEYLHKGYEFIPIAEVANRISLSRRLFLSGRTCGNGFISITLDDGYADNYENAYPIFKKYNIPFCIYLCEKMLKGEIQKENNDNYHFLTPYQLSELIGEPLCTLGGHTSSHASLSQLSKELQRIEIEGCKLWIESLTNKPMLDFAFPYGKYNNNTIKVLQELGIIRIVAAWGGPIRNNVKYEVIPRRIVEESIIND